MFSRASSTVATLCFTILLTLPAVSRAQSGAERPAALLRQGVALERAGEHERAVEVLGRLIAARPSGRALATLGAAELALGRMFEAEEHLLAALRFNRERWIRRHRAQVEGSLMTVRASVGLVRVTSNVDDAEIVLDGRVIGQTPMREGVRLPAGRVVLTVRAPGCAPTTHEVNIIAGREVQAHVSLDRDSSVTAAATASASRVDAEQSGLRCAAGLVLRNGLCHMTDQPSGAGTSAFRWLTYVGAGLAVASAGVAVGLWMDGNSLEDQYATYCGGNGAPRDCVALHREAQETLSSQATLVNVFLVLSAVSVGTAVVGLTLDLTSGRRARVTSRAGLSLAPMGVRLTW